MSLGKKISKWIRQVCVYRFSFRHVQTYRHSITEESVLFQSHIMCECVNVNAKLYSALYINLYMQ